MKKYKKKTVLAFLAVKKMPKQSKNKHKKKFKIWTQIDADDVPGGIRTQGADTSDPKG